MYKVGFSSNFFKLYQKPENLKNFWRIFQKVMTRTKKTGDRFGLYSV
jgi:hypothetical protein